MLGDFLLIEQEKIFLYSIRNIDEDIKSFATHLTCIRDKAVEKH